MQWALLTVLFRLSILAVSTIIIKRIIFQINFDGIVLFCRLQQSYKRF